MLFTQPLAALGLLIALHGTICAQAGHGLPAALLGGLGLGLAGLSAVPSWITLPIYLVYLLRRDGPGAPFGVSRLRLAAAFGAGAGVFGLFQAVYNYARFGSFLEAGYQQVSPEMSVGYIGQGVLGLLLSAPRGILWFAPFVMLIPLGLWIAWRTPRRERLLLAAAQSAAMLLLYSAFAAWWGGLTWGPRYLVPVMPALTLLTTPVLDRLFQPLALGARLSITAILLISGLTQLLAVLFNYYDAELDVSHAISLIGPSARWIERAAVLADLSTLPVPRQLASMRAGKWEPLWISGGALDGRLLAAQMGLIGAAALALGFSLHSKPLRSDPRRVLILLPIAAAAAWYTLVRCPRPPDDIARLEPLVAASGEIVQPGDGIVFTIPYAVFSWLDRYDGQTHDIGLFFGGSLSQETTRYLQRMREWHGRVWVVHEGSEDGSTSEVIRWLGENAYIGTGVWVDAYRVVPYTLAASGPREPLRTRFGNGEIELAAFAAAADPQRRWINVELEWAARQTPPLDYTVFVQLLDASGMPVAQHDGAPAAGYHPTSSWRPGERILDRRHITLPASLPPGVYQVIAGLYDPATGERLPLADGSGDALLLDMFQHGD